jgi:hypothetical protein
MVMAPFCGIELTRPEYSDIFYMTLPECSPKLTSGSCIPCVIKCFHQFEIFFNSHPYHLRVRPPSVAYISMLQKPRLFCPGSCLDKSFYTVKVEKQIATRSDRIGLFVVIYVASQEIRGKVCKFLRCKREYGKDHSINHRDCGLILCSNCVITSGLILKKNRCLSCDEKSKSK